MPSGTIYPAVRRLERDSLIRSSWEDAAIAEQQQRPARKYYKVTAAGRTGLQLSRARYPLLDRMFQSPKERV